MKKTIAFLSVLFLAVFLAGCNKSEPGAQEQSSQKNQTQEKEAQKENSKLQSLKDLMKKGKNLKCTWKNEQPDGGTVEGVSYISGEKFYHESNIEQAGEATTVYTMSDGGWVYNWGNMNSQGTKMKIEEMEEMQGEASQMQTDSGQSENYQAQQQMEQDMDFDCQSWKADNSKFTPPNNVEFQDMSKMMEQVQQQTQEMEQQMEQMEQQAQQGQQQGQQSANQMMQDACSMCNSLPSPAKEECLANCQ